MRQADTFDLKTFLAEGQLEKNLQEVDINLDDKEQSVVDDIKDEMSAIIKGLDTELTKATEKEQPTNEGLLTVASIAIALPAVMGLVAKLGKGASTIVNKLLGKKPDEKSAYNQWMAKLGHIADELHHLYMAPIESIDTSNPIMAAIGEMPYTKMGLHLKPMANMNKHQDISKEFVNEDLVDFNVEMFRTINGL